MPLNNLKESLRIRLESNRNEDLANRKNFLNEEESDSGLTKVINPGRALRYFNSERAHVGHFSGLDEGLANQFSALGEYDDYKKKAADKLDNFYSEDEFEGVIKQENDEENYNRLEYQFKLIMVNLNAPTTNRPLILNRILKYGDSLFEKIHKNAKNPKNNLDDGLKKHFEAFKALSQHSYVKHETSFFQSFRSFKRLVTEKFKAIVGVFVHNARYVQQQEAKRKEEAQGKIDINFNKCWENLKELLIAAKNGSALRAEDNCHWDNFSDYVVDAQVSEKIEQIKNAFLTHNFKKNSDGLDLPSFIKSKLSDSGLNLDDLKLISSSWVHEERKRQRGGEGTQLISTINAAIQIQPEAEDNRDDISPRFK